MELSRKGGVNLNSRESGQAGLVVQGSYLQFQVNDWCCALPTCQVREILRPLPVSRVEAAPEFLLGLTLLRGTPTPVVEAGLLLRGRRVVSTRFIALRVGERTVLLAVTRVDGVVDALPNAGTPPPLLAQDLAVVTDLSLRDAELVAVLDAAVLVAEIPTQEGTAS